MRRAEGPSDDNVAGWHPRRGQQGQLFGVPTVRFLDAFHASGLTTDAARDSGDISRACKESGPNKTIKSPSSLDHRYVHEDVGFGLVAFSAFGSLAGVSTPVIDSHVTLFNNWRTCKSHINFFDTYLPESSGESCACSKSDC